MTIARFLSGAGALFLALSLVGCFTRQSTTTTETPTPAVAGTPLPPAVTETGAPLNAASETPIPVTGASAQAGGGVGWGDNAVSHRGSNGENFDYNCGAGGTPGSVWGTDIYTDDSSVCTAAVHNGRITLQQGGTVTIKIRPGLPLYTGSTANGITSGNWNSWNGSFIFVNANR
jgi:LCCL domain-containing protein